MNRLSTGLQQLETTELTRRTVEFIDRPFETTEENIAKSFGLPVNGLWIAASALLVSRIVEPNVVGVAPESSNVLRDTQKAYGAALLYKAVDNEANRKSDTHTELWDELNNLDVTRLYRKVLALPSISQARQDQLFADSSETYPALMEFADSVDTIAVAYGAHEDFSHNVGAGARVGAIALAEYAR